jgi:head-tail adaptor
VKIATSKEAIIIIEKKSRCLGVNMKIKPGDLRDSIKIYRKEFKPDEKGVYNRDTTLIAETRAKIEPLTNRALFEANNTSPGTDYKIWIRTVPGVEKGMIITDDKTFETTRVIDLRSRPPYSEIWCRKITNTNS